MHDWPLAKTKLFRLSQQEREKQRDLHCLWQSIVLTSRPFARSRRRLDDREREREKSGQGLPLDGKPCHIHAV